MTSLLDKFFAPRSSSASSGAAGAAHAGVDVARLDHSILPPFSDDGSTDGEDAWDTVWVAEIPLPPVGTGQAVLKTPIKIKIDKTTKTGAAKPKVKNVGGEAIEGTIKVRFVQEALPAMVAAAATLYPGAGPFPIRHPKATMAKLDHIEISGWADAPDPDEHGIFEWTLTYVQVSIAAQNGKGGSGVKTPKTGWYNAKPGDPAHAEARAAVAGEQAGTIPGEAATAAKKEAAKAGAAP